MNTIKLISLLVILSILSCKKQEQVLSEKPIFYFDGQINGEPFRLEKEESLISIPQNYNCDTTETFIFFAQDNRLGSYKDTLIQIIPVFSNIPSKNDVIDLIGQNLQLTDEDRDSESGCVNATGVWIELMLNDSREYAYFTNEYDGNDFVITEVKEDDSFEVWESLKDFNVSATYYVKGTTSFNTIRSRIVDNELIYEETDNFIEGEFAIRLLAFGE